MIFRYFLVPAALTITACSIGASSDQMDALNGCTKIWRTEFPQLYGEKTEETQKRALAVMLPEEIFFDSSGDFVVRQPPDEWREKYDMQFDCEGNIETRTINVVRVGNREIRPAKGQTWSFE